MKRWPIVTSPASTPSTVRRHDLAAEQHHQPVHRAHELRIARAPAHALRNRQRIQALLHQARQQRARWQRRVLSALEAAGTRCPWHRARARALRAPRRSCARSRSRRASGAPAASKLAMQRRSAALDELIGLCDGEPPDQHRQPARRRKRFDRAVTAVPPASAACAGPRQTRVRASRSALGGSSSVPSSTSRSRRSMRARARRSHAALHAVRLRLADAAAPCLQHRKAERLAAGVVGLRHARAPACAPAGCSAARSVTEIARRASSRLKVCEALSTCS